MYINLPTVEERYDEESKTVIVTESTLQVDIDTSFYAHQKWAEQFERTMGMDLIQYTNIVSKWVLEPERAVEKLLGISKLLYCYINSPKLPTFNDFLKFFKPRNALAVIEKVNVVLQEVNKTVSKN